MEVGKEQELYMFALCLHRSFYSSCTRKFCAPPSPSIGLALLPTASARPPPPALSCPPWPAPVALSNRALFPTTSAAIGWMSTVTSHGLIRVRPRHWPRTLSTRQRPRRQRPQGCASIATNRVGSEHLHTYNTLARVDTHEMNFSRCKCKSSKLGFSSL